MSKIHEDSSPEMQRYVEAIKQNDIATVKAYLDEKPYLAFAIILNEDGLFPAIHYAAYKEHAEMVLLMASYEKNLGFADSQGHRLLNLKLPTAIRNSIDSQKDRTPLMMAACRRKNMDCIKTLLDHGAVFDPGKPDQELLALKSVLLDYSSEYAEYERLDAEKKQSPLSDLGDAGHVFRFDELVSLIQQQGGKLAKRIPAPRLANGKYNPEFIAFGEALHFAEMFNTSFCCMDIDNGVIPALMDHTSGKWSDVVKEFHRFTSEDMDGLQDAVKAFTKAILIPEFARRTKHLTQSGKIEIRSVVAHLEGKVMQVLLGSRGLPVMLDLQKDWHYDRAMLEKNIRDPHFVRYEKWLPLTSDYTASNGLTVRFVPTAEQLMALGNDQDHCVGGYVDDCAAGSMHVGVIARGTDVLSTFALDEHHGDKKFTLEQHKGKKNTDIDPKAPEQVALDEFLEKANSEKIPIDFAGIEKKREQNYREGSDVRRVCGFDVFNEKNSVIWENKALEHYLKIRTGGRKDSIVRRSHSFLPGGERAWEGKSAKQFLEETGLMRAIDEIAKDPPLASENARNKTTRAFPEF